MVNKFGSTFLILFSKRTGTVTFLIFLLDVLPSRHLYSIPYNAAHISSIFLGEFSQMLVRHKFAVSVGMIPSSFLLSVGVKIAIVVVMPDAACIAVLVHRCAAPGLRQLI